MENEIGNIKIERTTGVEIWDVTAANFSIDKPAERYRLNFWVESEEKLIKKLGDTGHTPVIFEIKLAFEDLPDFSNGWQYKYPGYKQIEERDFGDNGEGFWDNFYYYDHESLENIMVKIQRERDGKYFIEIVGDRKDPIDPVLGMAKYSIWAKVDLTNKLNSYWMDEN